MKSGRIVAVCTSPNEGVPKWEQTEVELAEFGFKGDYHCKPMRRSFSKPGTEKPNTDRHITIVAKEAVDAVNEKLGLQLGIGALGENLLIEGFGDLSDIIPHTEIVIHPGLILKVVEQNQPCKNLVHYHPHLVKEIYGRRGLLCKVVLGVGKIIKPGDPITIFSAQCRNCGCSMLQYGACWLCRNCGCTLGS